MTSKIYLNARLDFTHEVVLKIKDIKDGEVLVEVSSFWKGQEDCIPTKQWVGVGDTFTVTKPIILT